MRPENKQAPLYPGTIIAPKLTCPSLDAVLQRVAGYELLVVRCSVVGVFRRKRLPTRMPQARLARYLRLLLLAYPGRAHARIAGRAIGWAGSAADLRGDPTTEVPFDPGKANQMRLPPVSPIPPGSGTLTRCLQNQSRKNRHPDRPMHVWLKRILPVFPGIPLSNSGRCTGTRPLRPHSGTTGSKPKR